MKLDVLADKRIFDFVITVPSVVDKEGDVVPPEEIEEALDGWLIRGAPITDMHSNRVIGKGLRFLKDNEGKYVGRGLVHDDNKVSDEVWEKIQNDEYKSVSIGGAAFEKVPNQHGGFDLNGLEILEVAVCPVGMHQEANVLDKNMLAKIAKAKAHFFWKADISTYKKDSDSLVLKPGDHSEKWKRCVEDVKGQGGVRTPEAVCTAALGAESFKSFSYSEKALINKLQNKNRNGGFDLQKSNPGVDVKKPDMEHYERLTQQLASLMEAVQEIKEGMASAPMVESRGDKPDDDVVKPEDKPEEEEDETKKEGGIGMGEVSDTTGAKVVMPANADMNREPQGEPGKEEGDKVKLTVKAIKDVVKAEVAKSLKKSSTPVPTVEKALEAPRNEFAMAPWDIIRGNKTSADFTRKNGIQKMEQQISFMRAADSVRRVV